MSVCQDTLNRIEGYLDGELPGEECLLVERHCRTCASCASFVEGLRQAVGLCREAARAPLPEDVRARALESVRKLLEK